MKTTIDKAGRLVIPRSLRAGVGLDNGGEVNVEISGASILIEPVAGQDLAKEGEFIVIPATGQALDDASVRELRHADQR